MDDKTNKLAESIRACLDCNLNGVKQAFFNILNLEFHEVPDFKFHASNVFTSQFKTIACVPFAGPITGEFFLCMDKSILTEPLVELSGYDASTTEFEDLLYSTLQELANTAMGATIHEVKAAFGVVTMLSPRLIEGTLRYPKTRMFHYFLVEKHKKFVVEIHLSFDLMEQDLVNVFEKLESESKLDVTGLYNKKFFQKTLEEIEIGQRQRVREVSMIFMDINRLKYVNDTFGHEAGDNYIQEACNIMRNSCRPSDRCFRIGGDEIVAILMDCSQEGAQQVENRMVQRMAQTVMILSHDGVEEKIPVAGSIGLASTSEGIALGELLKTADGRMEENKRAWYEKNKIDRRK